MQTLTDTRYTTGVFLLPVDRVSLKPTTRQIGWVEPGFDKFAEFYKEGGTKDETISQYAGWIGTVRNLFGRPLLDLTVAELKELDKTRLRTIAKCYRVGLRMFYTGNERDDLKKALRPLRNQKQAKFAFEEIIFPTEAQAIIAQAGNLRDRALIATLYASGCRIDEILTLRMKHIVQSNGGYQLFLGKVKSRGQERYSPKIEGVWKQHLEEWLAAHPQRGEPEAWVFSSTNEDGTHVSDSTINSLLHGLAKKAGVSKRGNAHWYRHSRISLAFARKEGDLGTICIWFWGVPVTPMANRYSHFQGLETSIEGPKPIELPPVPALPVPLISQTRKQVAELTARLEAIEREPARQFVRFLETAMKDDPKLKERLLAASKKSGWLP
jgi:integrase